MIIAIDFGGTNIKLGIVEDGNIICYRSILAKSRDGIRPRLQQVTAEVTDMLKKAGIPLSACNGVGIGIPGIVDYKNKRVVDINQKYSDALSVDFSEWCGEVFHLPLWIDNDTKCAILGETQYGCAVGCADAVLMSFGTGIGTSAIMDGKLVRGRHDQAGCLGGHLIIDFQGRVCTCGNRGCVEALASTSTLPMAAGERPGFGQSLLSKAKAIDYKAVIDCAGRGDTFSIDFLTYLLQCWGAGLVNLIHAYDPETIILSGGLMKAKDLILPRLQEYVTKNAWAPWGKVDFRIAEDPNTSVLLGACAMLKQEQQAD